MKDIAQLSINTIRFLAVDAIEQAQSGHPGMPMGMAPLGYLLYTQILKHNPQNPQWVNRDRFILSAGHGSMLLYALLHLTGYDLTLKDLKEFRQWNSRTPGHPEYGLTPGVETTTGPLGQGLATAVGMAIGQRYLNSLFPTSSPHPLLDYKIYGIVSDGDIMEGLGAEAGSLAGHLGLESLIFFYDDNRISIDGATDLAMSEDVKRRFEASNWFVQNVGDANDLNALRQAAHRAQGEKNRPSLIMVRSHIGFGSPNKMDTEKAHGEPLGKEETKLTKDNLGWTTGSPFIVPDEVKTHMAQAIQTGAALEKEWNERFETWAKSHPDEFKLWNRLLKGELPMGWEKNLPDLSKEEKMSTRAASGRVINALAPIMPELIGGSADLTGSNNTAIKSSRSFSQKMVGRNIHFGVREHAMAAALNGLALSGMLIPYGGTFLIFTDYMKGAMRISALLGKRVIYILTHDSIALGEDGPTHQPVEQVSHLRAVPNMVVIRPADAHETVAAWKVALNHKSGPVCLILTRQNVPVIPPTQYPALGQVEKGGYILSEAKSSPPQVILMATGSEVSPALTAQTTLQAEGISTRVVSLPCWELFDQQPQKYREAVLPPSVTKRVSIEALSTMGWSKYVGLEGDSLGMTTFGASAPGSTLLEKFGFSADAIVARVKKLLG